MITDETISSLVQRLRQASRLPLLWEHAFECMVQAPGMLYAVWDTARTPKVTSLLTDFGRQTHQVSDHNGEPTRRVHASLYEDRAASDFGNLGPALVSLSSVSWLQLRGAVKQAWGNYWGIFIHSSRSFDHLRHHLRRYTMASLPSGETVVFRFHDPRVLPYYLQACSPSEVLAFFDGIHAVTLEDEVTHAILTLRCGSNGTLLASREEHADAANAT